MKNLLIIIAFSIILNSCKSSSDLFVDRYVPNQSMIQTPNEGPDGVFAQNDLDTLYSNKKKVKVALFFPFSGKHRELGWALYNASLMSLFDNDVNHNLELVLIDSKDNAVEASQVFHEIKDRNIDIVIGPVFSNFVIGTAKNTIRNSVKAISLSNNQALAGNIDEKGAVFIAGFLPEQQIDRIVSYALDHKKRNFAILAPNNSYGIEITKILKNVVDLRYGNLIQSELYNINSKDNLKKAVKRIVNTYSVAPDLAEGGGNYLEEDFRLSKGDKKYADIIIIPDSGKNIEEIADLIKKYNDDEREIQIVGIGGFDDLDSINSSSLNGAWFAAPINDRFESFEKAYYQNYGKLPPRISSIAYDSVAAIAKIVDTIENDKPTVQNFIDLDGKKSGFEGIDGQFRFLENGLTQRNLAILQVDSGKLKVIDAPTEKFLNY
jgi:ABC-type branched-subunit amino acid transport system substrate-binding protein